MSIEHGTRVLIKSAMQMGMKRDHYLFSEYAGQHLFVVEPELNHAGCYVLCPAHELDGENDKYRPWNEKRPYHITMPECCFMLDPVTPKEKTLRKNVTSEKKVRDFLESLDPAQLQRYYRAMKAVQELGIKDIETLLKLMNLLEFKNG